MTIKERWNRFWNGKPKPEPEPKEKVDGWKLKIIENGITSDITTTDYKQLWKVYHWYLTKDSEKYNVTYRYGMYIVERKNITFMSLTKARLIKEYL